jgi:hypothetical protein
VSPIAATGGRIIQQVRDALGNLVPGNASDTLNNLGGTQPGASATGDHHTSLPSEEKHPNLPENVGGVGSLPGDLGEEGVALLPHEKCKVHISRLDHGHITNDPHPEQQPLMNG